MIKTKHRINWIDMAKGYGMILVILGHIGDLGGYGWFKLWFFSFHMPLFFFLSGYVFKETDRFSTFLKKKLRSLVIPYFCLGIPMVIFQCLWDYKSGTFTPESGINMLLELIIQRRTWTIWFIACLFLLSIMFYFAKKLLRHDIALAILSVVCVIIGALYYHFGGKALPWCYDACFMAFPFFFAGHFCKEKQSVINSFFRKKSRIIVVMFLSLAVSIGSSYLNIIIAGKGLNMYNNEYGCIPITYAAAFVGIVFMIMLSALITFKPIRYIGENSIIYLAWQETIMIPIAEKILIVCCNIAGISYDDLHTLIHYGVVLIIVIALITVCNIIITHTPLRFMVGKRKPKEA